ncbi:hypothetical protein [Lentilactobacillus hilgardii]|uniref:hypothetical protein n=1 Tax=Lentilactobacillus hilgardii TaxID=1588 RepID=UPI0021A61117|nr:hypothetical protein [Lentilactobacillus hilgardii]MCT3398868.1 hypothetical protein [Lentilactobacillus hilgardii]
MAALKATNINQWLDKATKQELREIVLKQAQTDDALYYELQNRFGDLSDKEKLSELRAYIRNIIGDNNDRGFIDYHDCITVCDVLDDITHKAAKVVPTEDLNFAIQEVLMVIRSTIGFLERADDSSGCTTETLDFAFATLEKLSKAAATVLSDQQKTALIKSAVQVFNLKIFDDWDNFRYAIFEKTMPLISKNSLKLMEKATAKISDRYAHAAPKDSDFFDDVDFTDNYKDFQLNEIKAYNANLKSMGLITIGDFAAAKKVMAENITFNSVRKTAIDFYLSQKDFRTAEKLAVNGALSKNNNLDDQATWFDYLEKIYLQTKDYHKLAGVYKSRLLQPTWGSFNLDDYKKLKGVIQMHGDWQQAYPALLTEFSQKLTPTDYASILSFEKETTKLMAVVGKVPSLVSEHGKTLFKRFPDKVTTLYYKALVDQDIGNTRKHYRELGRTIRHYADYGDKGMARYWCQQLIKQYPRRSALIDEMQKAYELID